MAKMPCCLRMVSLDQAKLTQCREMKMTLESCPGALM
jgi:hypothetical protein